MRIEFRYKSVHDDAPTIVETQFMDMVKAERHFKTSARAIVEAASFEQWAFLVWSRVAHTAARTGGAAVKPFAQFLEDVEGVEMVDVHTLEDDAGNSKGAESETRYVEEFAP